MVFGKVPAPEVVKTFEVSMVLYAEHGFNASTFTARTVVSSLSDIYSGVVGGIASLERRVARRRERSGDAHAARNRRARAREGMDAECVARASAW